MVVEEVIVGGCPFVSRPWGSLNNGGFLNRYMNALSGASGDGVVHAHLRFAFID